MYVGLLEDLHCDGGNSMKRKINFPLNNFSYKKVPTLCTRQKTCLHAQIQVKAYITDCVVRGKPSKQVIKETIAKYLQQTAETHETIRKRLVKCRALFDGCQCGAFTFVPGEGRKLPPATDEHFTLRNDEHLPTMRHSQDSCPFSRREITIKTITRTTI